jgi:type IV pilus assembly protein PilW
VSGLRPAAGFSLAELLVAALLASGISLGALQLYQQSLRAYRSTEQLADLEERAAFALRALTDDIALAGFWGRYSSPATLAVPAGLAVRCGGTDITAWALQRQQPVEARNAALVMPCAPFTAAVGGADSLVIRHASSVPALPRAGQLQLATRVDCAELFANGSVPAACATDSSVHNVEVHAWYVDRAASTRGMPSLRRYTLVTNGLLQNQEIMPGVEDMQVALGVDRDADGWVDAFINPDEAGSAPVIAVRIGLRVRALRREPGLGRQVLPSGIDARAGPQVFTDSFRRITAERTVFAPNLAHAAAP